MRKEIKEFIEILEKDHVSESASQCAYYVILSFIPFIILLLTLIQFTEVNSQQLIEFISNIVPGNMRENITNIIREVYSKSIGTVSISLIFTVFSADRGLFALMKELRLIYNSEKNEDKSWIYLKLLSIIQTIIFIVLIALTLIIMVFGNAIIDIVKEHIRILNNYSLITQVFSRIAYILILFIAFSIMYKIMSGNNLKLRKHFKGAIFASVALNIISFIFSKYLEIFKGFSTTYGSLTALMLIMMWTYSCFYTIFIGAEINKLKLTQNLK